MNINHVPGDKKSFLPNCICAIIFTKENNDFIIFSRRFRMQSYTVLGNLLNALMGYLCEDDCEITNDIVMRISLAHERDVIQLKLVFCAVNVAEYLNCYGNNAKKHENYINYP